MRHTATGARLILQTAGPGDILAEASAYSETYHCDAVAVEEAEVSALPRARFLSALAENSTLAEAWAARLARGMQAARLRAEIRTLPRLADRLTAWLDAGNALPARGRWQDVAAELGVTREALYRELARRRAAQDARLSRAFRPSASHRACPNPAARPHGPACHPPRCRAST